MIVERHVPRIRGVHVLLDDAGDLPGEWLTVDDDAHLAVQLLGARVEVHRADEDSLSIHHRGLDVKAHELRMHRWRIRERRAHRGIGA